MLSSHQIEAATQALYAAGPWGKFEGFRDDGSRCATDSHNIDVYREIVHVVIDALDVEAPDAQASAPGPTHTEHEE